MPHTQGCVPVFCRITGKSDEPRRGHSPKPLSQNPSEKLAKLQEPLPERVTSLARGCCEIGSFVLVLVLLLVLETLA